VTTPLRRQYLEIKQRYPHAILFFRMGDFYETFDEDAEVVARELEITLTSRPLNKTERTPLAGIPHHALDSYLGKLIAKGYRVAICEQTTTPEKGKKIVDREVLRVVTPGTVVEENLLDVARNNYLAAYVPGPAPFDRAEALSVRKGGGMAGLAHVDVSTGEFACLQASAEAVAAELERLRPAELLLPQGAAPPPGIAATLTPLGPLHAETAVQTLLRHFAAPSAEALGLGGQTLAQQAAGLVLEYLAENQRAVLGHITRVLPAQAGGHMLLDANTRRNLEIFEPLHSSPDARPGPGSLLAVLDFTETPMGARLLRKWLGQPLLDAKAIAERQDGVQLFFDSAVRRAEARALLKPVPDIERTFARVSSAAQASLAATTPRDLAALRRGLEAVPVLRSLLEEITGDGQKRTAQRLVANMHPCAEAASLIAAAIADEPAGGSAQTGARPGAIRIGFSDELDTLRATARDARQYLADLERRERERTGIKSLKVGYNRVFGYYIEISNANKEPVPEDYQRKQTLVGAERYTTAELREHEYRVLHAQELETELESSLLKQVCTQVAAHGARILEAAAAVAALDVLCGLAEAAARYGYVRPLVDESTEVVVRDGRHPVVERMLAEGSFVPNDIYLASEDAQLILLTGPNMAGKSTYLRMAAVIVLMAQAGSFVPAREARIGLVDRIYSRVGALDDIASGHSTFMVEMLETAAMLAGSTGRSLLIFDEIGRGTSTYDGMAIARAVAEYIHNRPEARARTLFATHYHELVELAGTLPRVRNFNVAVAEEGGGVVFLHRILPGGADRSYGVHVAQLAGLPRAVVARANEILAELEAGGAVRAGALTHEKVESDPQLSLFGQANDALRAEVAALDVNAMSPLEALNRLYELAERARKSP
jgi:DNA mismatch repair protein MutS